VTALLVFDQCHDFFLPVAGSDWGHAPSPGRPVRSLGEDGTE
jgi:hypothetical protein